MDIRKISVGPDYKTAMHYIVGQAIFDVFVIHLIHLYPERNSVLIYIEKNNEVLLWKEFTQAMPMSIEYNINF